MPWPKVIFRVVVWRTPPDACAGLLGVRGATAPGPPREGIGAEVAARSLTLAGSLPVISSAVVVELRSTTNPAVGDAGWGLAEPMRDLGVAAEAVQVTRAGPTVDSVVDLAVSRALVIAVRDAYRSEWQRAWVSDLLEHRPDAVLVGLGMPHDAVFGAATSVLAYGAGRANTDAVARRLAGSPS